MYTRVWVYMYVYMLPSGGGDDMLGSPHPARAPQFELFELEILNSSFSSLSSY